MSGKLSFRMISILAEKPHQRGIRGGIKNGRDCNATKNPRTRGLFLMSAKLVQRLRPDDYSKSVRSLHLVFHAMRELLDLFGLLDHVHGEDMLIGLVHVGLQVNRQPE